MTRKPHDRISTLVLVLLQVFALTAAISLRAQSTAAPTDADQAARNLAKYDKNQNGKLDPDELAAMQADEAGMAAAPVAATPGTNPDAEAVLLSPFEVREANNGYYAANTMSGTRLNTRIEDLGSAISVVTKQQMADFGMLDINDIFNYEASTEGTGNFTAFSVDRNGMVTDNIQNDPQSANRIRGIGGANLALNNFATSGRVPIDPIAIDGVEISRGPNSNIFGLGQGSGTVNLLAASAGLNRRTTTAAVRIDSLGGYRTSLDLNRPVIAGKLAVRASAVYQHDGFNEKPSGDTSRRLNFLVRVQPFKTTSVRASFQQYDFYGSRASSITPRDTISYWKSVGSPTWDPTTSTVTVNGVSTAMGAANPAVLGNAGFSNPVIYVDQTGIGRWQIQRMPAPTAINGPNNTGLTGTARLLETSAPPIRTNRPLYATVPGISDKALFDWTAINLASANSLKDHNEMTTVEVEQFFINTERHTLAVQGGWNHERASRYNKNIVGQSTSTGSSNYLYVDINSKLLDGRANPYFLRPYLGFGEPKFTSNPYLRDTFRGQGAYKLDFTTENGWAKWLGRHSLVGYMEQRLTKAYTYRFKPVNINDSPIYAPAGQPKANANAPAAPLATRPYVHFYVGDNNGQNVDYGPTALQSGPTTFSWFNPLSQQWINDPATLADAAMQDGNSAGSAASQTLLKTRGLVLQSAVLQDRLIFTGGKRHDENNSKFQKPSALMPDGYTFDYAAMDGFVNDTLFKQGPWATRTGDTTTKGAVAKPFRGWRAIDRAARESGAGGFFAGLLRGLSVYYNQSDSFTPNNPAISVTLENLPNPTAIGKDYGFSLTLWNDKLILRANRYETNQINNRNGEFNTFGQRTLRLDLQNFAGNADAFSLQRQARAWVRTGNPTLGEQAVEDAVFKIMGLTAEQASTFINNPIGETQDITSKGDEIELNFNPDRFWSVKTNLTRTRALDSNIAPHIPAWIAQRLPVWESIIDPRTGVKWLDTGYTGDAPRDGSLTPRAQLIAGVLAPLQLAQATQGKSRPQIREWRFNTSASLRLAKYTEHSVLKNMTLGGTLRYESKGAIGYYGIPINGDITIATNFDGNRPIWSKANIYADAFATYSTRLFRDKVRTRFQLNVRNLQEWKAHLLAVGAYPDGTPHTFRIIEPISVIFTTTFDL